MSKEDFFKPENEQPGKKVELSPNDKYKLIITNFSTQKGCWSYSQGQVFKIGEDKPIAVVRRNYHAFPFLFIENHPNGHDYLVCGEDYQGQTVIELDTGKRLDHLSKGTDKGMGFCWVDYHFNIENKILVVDGCIWACPYEFRFYDFSDPMLGWTELVFDGDVKYIDDDVRQPVFNTDGTITCFQSDNMDDWEGEEGPTIEQTPIAATNTFRRDGNKLILVDSWVSEKEKIIRQKYEEDERKFREWRDNFEKTDPLYLEHLEQLKNPIFEPEKYTGMGITYDGWCPDFKGRESRYIRRIHHSRDKKYTIDFELAVKTGPVKLIIFKAGNRYETKFFMEHSVESVKQAFAYAENLLKDPK